MYVLDDVDIKLPRASSDGVPRVSWLLDDTIQTGHKEVSTLAVARLRIAPLTRVNSETPDAVLYGRNQG